MASRWKHNNYKTLWSWCILCSCHITKSYNWGRRLPSEMRERERGMLRWLFLLSLPQCVYCALYRLYCHHLSAVMVISEWGVRGNLQLKQTLSLMRTNTDEWWMVLWLCKQCFVCCISVTWRHVIPGAVTPLLPRAPSERWRLMSVGLRQLPRDHQSLRVRNLVPVINALCGASVSQCGAVIQCSWL